MYLSKLEIIGFKSFAQRVNLAFDSGMSAIVGPNGCGKTNIVDAIRWVLGEQRYSALRSEKMEDVIFNGTKTRKPLGMAEASLVIENTKGVLPSEYTQVTIGRRVYRSGESEYLLNKAPCRLKDILDLFMDTGMGADAYSVIELKMIETILSDKADERRRLFEEAAGVTKYKHRRKAAYRKLESVQADLVRVNDIVSEVQKAVTTLERQAKRAGQWNELTSRLKSLDIDLMEREYALYHSRKQPLEERLAGLREDKNRIDVDLSAEEARLDGLRTRLSEEEKRQAEVQHEALLQVDRINKLEQKNLVAGERIKALEGNIVRFEEEKSELRSEMDGLQQAKVTLSGRAVQLEAEEAEHANELQRKQEELKQFEARMDSTKAGLQSLNERLIALVHEIAEKRASLDRMKGRVENLSGRSMHAREENAAYGEDLQHLEEQLSSLIQEDKLLRRRFTEAEVKYYEAEARKNDLKQSLDDLHRTMLEVRSDIERTTAQVEFIKGLIESREDLSDGVRFLASSEQWGNKPVTVADIVSADAAHRAAIESALGEFAGLLVVTTKEDAERGMALLREQQRGKVMFVSLDRVPEIHGRRRLPAMAGVHGWAVDLASFDPVYAPLFRLLLDGVIVVDNLQTARSVLNRLTGVRCVTVEGEIATGVGITRGGSKRIDEGGMIGKQAQIEEMLNSIMSRQQELASLQHAFEEATRAHDAIDLKSFSDDVKAVEKEMNGVEMRMAQVEFEKKRAGDIMTKNTEEIAQLGSEIATLETQIKESLPGLESSDAEKVNIERTIGSVSTELESLEQEWNTKAGLVSELGITLVGIRNDLQTARRDLQRADERIADILRTLERRDGDILRARAEIEAAQTSVAETSTALEQLRNELGLIERGKEGIAAEVERIRNEIHSIELKIKDERRHHDESVNQSHELELKIADFNAKAGHLKARALEEYEHAIEIKTYPDDEFVDFAKLRDDIQAIRDRIKSMGNINFAAFEEYTTEKERFEFLSAQRKDLLEAEKTLLATIEEINTTAQRKFLETFGLIRKNFIDTFKSLFDPGDECDLKLEEDVDPLEAKIEIVAKPRGKRPTSIDLLSGGEKTLTAIALLFAIYLVKPSPFCILDEVDAPLDDANIDRFTRILRKFSDNTQFIVVTHNKRTMEAANALYGVTMEEEGVSKIVTVRFNQRAEVKSAELVSG
jgi:chromosome segregation protein